MTTEKILFTDTEVHDSSCAVEMSRYYCYCHLLCHNYQIRNIQTGVTLNQNSKRSAVEGNAEFVWSCCLIISADNKQLNQRLVCWSLSLSCPQKDGSSQNILGIFGFAYRLSWRCTQTWQDVWLGFSHHHSVVLYGSHWQTRCKTHEIPSEHKKSLFHCVRPVEHWHWWSGQTLSIPWSQSKPSWTHSWPVCAEGWAGQCEGVIPNSYNFVIDSVMSSASQGSRSWAQGAWRWGKRSFSYVSVAFPNTWQTE